MNAGMFEQDGSAVGWCVACRKTKEGQEYFSLKPNGVFAVQDVKALVRETDAAVNALGAATLFTQSGTIAGECRAAAPGFPGEFGKPAYHKRPRRGRGWTYLGDFCRPGELP
jgi:uncharacterized protein YigE (DUF2233 family)